MLTIAQMRLITLVGAFRWFGKLEIDTAGIKSSFSSQIYKPEIALGMCYLVPETAEYLIKRNSRSAETMYYSQPHGAIL